MEAEREVDDDAEVPPASAEGPEEFLVLVARRAHDSAVGGYDRSR